MAFFRGQKKVEDPPKKITKDEALDELQLNQRRSKALQILTSSIPGAGKLGT